MNYKLQLKCLLTFAILLSVQTSAWASGASNTQAAENNVVLQWNRVLQQTISTPGQHPATIFPVRSFAMMHAAMFDAVNSIEGSYTPYLIDVPARRVQPTKPKSPSSGQTSIRRQPFGTFVTTSPARSQFSAD